MKSFADESFPLTTAQRGLWFTQKISPSANMNIAEAVEIHGKIHPATFARALRQVASEAEQLRVQIIEEDAQPRQTLGNLYQHEFPYLDFSGEPEPQASIQQWMMREVGRPVDLARDPLWISALLKADENRYFWYHRAHHTVCDGYGGGMVARRVAELYTAYAEDRDPSPPSFCSVRSALEAETAYRSSRHWERDRQYWLRQLADLPEAVTLSRSPHRRGLSGKLLRSTGHLSAEMTRALENLARHVGISLPQLLISLVVAYYHRATGVNDLAVGMPVSGRITGVLRNCVGVCANMAPLRISLQPGITAPELFSQVSRLVMQSLRHQQYRYEDLRRDLGLVAHHQNIAWLGVNIEPFDYRLSFAGATATLHNLSNSSTEDLMVFVYDRGTDAGLRFDLDANPLLYSENELNDHRLRLTRMIEQVLQRPEVQLSQLDILAEDEKRRLVVEWNNTAGPVPETSLPGMVAHWAEATPDAPAVVFDTAVLTYRQLHERSVRQARNLIALGVNPGEIVAIAVPRSEQLLIALLAIARAGAGYLPLDTDSPLERTALVLDDAEPVAVLAELEMHGQFATRGFRPLCLADLDRAVDESGEEPDLSRPDERAYVLYTSGSTGRPKGVEITHSNLESFLQAMQIHFKPAAKDRFLALTTVIFDIAGLELFLPLTVGACVVMAGSAAVHNCAELRRLIERERVTHIQATPSVWRILLANSELRLDAVHALVGGEALSVELAAKLTERTARVTQLYGPTETTIWSTVMEIDEVGVAPPPIGRPILNTRIYVLDEDRRLAPTGTAGEIYIGGAGVANGYLRRPELTAERFLPDPFSADGARMFRTGDLGRWTEDGLLEFIGRADNQVKVNGHRIELGEIESVLAQHVSVAQAVAAAHPNESGSRSLIGYVVPRAGVQVNTESLRTFVGSRLPAYMAPAQFVILDELPLTPNGKLNRKALPKPESFSRELHTGPQTSVERRVALLWKQLLHLEHVGLYDGFFDIGGDSLNAAEMAALFPAWFGMELPLGIFFENPTLHALSRIVEDFTGEHPNPLAVMLPLRVAKNHQQKPLFCIHPVIGFSIGFSGLLRHLDTTIPVYGLQSRGLDGALDLPNSIEEVAADYCEQIRSIQPHGPYRVLGRSMGGLIGHCIAERLLREGEKIALLALIDSLLFVNGDALHSRTEAEEIEAAFTFLGIQTPDENMPRTLQQLNRFLLQAGQTGAIPAAERASQLVRSIGKNDPAFLDRLSGVMLNNVSISKKFVPRRIATDLLYFHAHSISDELEGLVHSGPSAWLPFVDGAVEIHDLDCHHEAVLDAGPAARIGSILNERLFGSGSTHLPASSSRLVLKENATYA